jgi:hypothetical protein
MALGTSSETKSSPRLQEGEPSTNRGERINECWPRQDGFPGLLGDAFNKGERTFVYSF